jgi:hypothetical protein
MPAQSDNMPPLAATVPRERHHRRLDTRLAQGCDFTVFRRPDPHDGVAGFYYCDTPVFRAIFCR